MPCDGKAIGVSVSTGAKVDSGEARRATAYADRCSRPSHPANIFERKRWRYRGSVLAVLMGGLLGGCALSGDWQAVDRPNGPRRPAVEFVSFSTGGRFTLTSSDDVDRRTVTGTYSFVFGRLSLRPDNEERPTYSGHRRPDGKLVVVGPEGMEKSRVVLEKSRP